MKNSNGFIYYVSAEPSSGQESTSFFKSLLSGRDYLITQTEPPIDNNVPEVLSTRQESAA